MLYSIVPLSYIKESFGLFFLHDFVYHHFVVCEIRKKGTTIFNHGFISPFLLASTSYMSSPTSLSYHIQAHIFIFLSVHNVHKNDDLFFPSLISSLRHFSPPSFLPSLSIYSAPVYFSFSFSVPSCLLYHRYLPAKGPLCSSYIYFKICICSYAVMSKIAANFCPN